MMFSLFTTSSTSYNWTIVLVLSHFVLIVQVDAFYVSSALSSSCSSLARPTKVRKHFTTPFFHLTTDCSNLEEAINGSGNTVDHQHYLHSEEDEEEEEENVIMDQRTPISNENHTEATMENAVPPDGDLESSSLSPSSLSSSSSLVSSDLERLLSSLSSSSSSSSSSSLSSDLSSALTNDLSPVHPFAPPLTYKKFLTMQVSGRQNYAKLVEYDSFID
jgi:hypothetical protein